MSSAETEMLWQKACLVAQMVASAVKISERAGSIIKSIMTAGDLKVVEKGVNDLQTEADRAAQYCIIRSLKNTFGDKIKIIGEEEDEKGSTARQPVEAGFSSDVLQRCALDLPPLVADVKEEDIVVWVDPLDGTAEFAQGILEPVTVLIGIAVGGRPIAGIIHQPYYKPTPDTVDPSLLGRTIWSIRGIGVFGMQLRPMNNDQKLIVTTRSHQTQVVVDAISALKERHLADEVLKIGGAGFKVLKLLESGAHAYVFASPGCKKWDTCAPEALLNAAGGQMTDMHGDDLCYDSDVQRKNSGGVLATGPGVKHARYVAAIPDSVKAALPAKI